MRIIFLLVMLVSILVVEATGQVQKLYPVDEATKDPTFFTFRARLMQAVQRRDATYLLSTLSPKIQNSFGGVGGIAEFKQMWKPERPQSDVWIELAKALSLGGAFLKDGAFGAPYTYSKWPEDASVDVFEAGAIIDENVRVRAAPQITSSVMQTLSFDIVEVPDWQPNKARAETRNWIRVKLSDGRSGYVAEEFIRSAIDYRAVFEKQQGRWLMTAFIAGD
jgi:hypothetical protein